MPACSRPTTVRSLSAHGRVFPTEPLNKGTVVWLTLLGAYLNAAAYGFKFSPTYDYDVLLPLMNWLRDPSLYPGDALRADSSPFLIVFWWVVARLSNHFSTEHILFAAFLLTKLVFFFAVARLVWATTKSRAFSACIVSAIALSPLLNSVMPFGGSRVLLPIETHYSFGFALLVLTGVLLTEGRWWWAVILASVGVYIDALVFLFTLFAFAAFALADWKQHKWRVLGTGVLGAALSAPWVVLSRQSVQSEIPAEFLQALFTFDPFHFTLQWTAASILLKGTAILIAAVWMAILARRAELLPHRRFEILTASYLVPLVLGIFFGELYRYAPIVRMHLLRADSFLVPYALLLIQVYGANLLVSRAGLFPLTTLFLGLSALVFPLSMSLGLVPIFLGLVFETDPRKRFEALAGKLAGPLVRRVSHIPIRYSAAALCGTAVLVAFLMTVPGVARLWNFSQPLTPVESACVDLQLWMKVHTAPRAHFLVPTVSCGFRTFSERTTWGEWADGNHMIAYPPFASIFLQRMTDLGLPPGHPFEFSYLQENYKNLPWERMVAIAQKNRLDFIVQFKDVSYPARPVYENQGFALYRVP